MRIENIEIKDFKGIDALEFKPKKLNFIVGRNNTGKSSILQAINMVFNPIRASFYSMPTKLINFHSKYSETIIQTSEKKRYSIKIEKADENETMYQFKKDLVDSIGANFHKLDKKFDETLRVEIENKISESINKELVSFLTKESIAITINDKNKKIYYQLFRRDSRRVLIDFIKSILEYLKSKIHPNKSEISHIERRLLLDASSIAFGIEERNMKHEMKENNVLLIEDALMNYFIIVGDQEIDRINKVEKFLKEYNIIDGLERLSLEEVLFVNGEKIPFEFLGDGSKAIIGLLWSISSKEISDRVILLDEPENHMHPGYIKELLKILIRFSKEFNIQFFIATHNIDFINMIFDKDLTQEEKDYLQKEVFVMRMEKIKDYTSPVKFNYEDSKNNIEKMSSDLRGI